MPIGAFYGKGKRTGVYGAYLLACYNADTEDYETICKIGTGFSDEQLKTFYDELSPHVIPGPKSYYQWEQIPKDTPDVWLDARTVWEVSAADLSISPVHKAAVGLVDDAKGIALRYTLPSLIITHVPHPGTMMNKYADGTYLEDRQIFHFLRKPFFECKVHLYSPRTGQ